MLSHCTCTKPSGHLFHSRPHRGRATLRHPTSDIRHPTLRFPNAPARSPHLKHPVFSSNLHPMEDYRQRITIEPGKRGGKPCIRHMRITVYDVLGWLASGMSNAEILADFPELTTEDIQAALAFAADREHHLVAASA